MFLPTEHIHDFVNGDLAQAIPDQRITMLDPDSLEFL